MTGNRVTELMESFIMLEGHQMTKYEMQSMLNPETKCEVWDYKIANTLFLVSHDLSETCAARWKAHSSSCDVLVHAHDGKDCDLLYKFRLITDQCEAPLVVVHSDKDLMQCYSDRVAEARTKSMMPLDDQCTAVQHSVLLQDKAQKGKDIVPALRSALQQTAALVKERYSHLANTSSMIQHTNSTQQLRKILHRGRRTINDMHTEFLRRMQYMPHEPEAISFLDSSVSTHAKKTKEEGPWTFAGGVGSRD
jgi:hypothetical protein